MKQKLFLYQNPEKSDSLSYKMMCYSHNFLNKIFKWNIICEFDSLKKFSEKSLEIDNRFIIKDYISFFDGLLFSKSSDLKDEWSGKYVYLEDFTRDFSLRFTATHPWKNNAYALSRESWMQINSLKSGDRVITASSWWGGVPYIRYIRKDEDYHKRGKEKINIPDYPSQLIDLDFLKDRREKELILK